MYKLVGADRREYGPIGRETVLEWIAQGRANAQTIARFEEGAWKPLGTFEEFRDALAAATPPLISGSATVYTSTGTTSTQVPPLSSEPPPFSGVGSRSETNIASVIGICAPLLCCCCCYVGPVVGIIASSIGLSQIRSNPHRYSTSEALPKIGLGISIVMLLLHILDSFLKISISKYFPTGNFRF